MFYSIISTLALILHFIINGEALSYFSLRGGQRRSEQQTELRYSYFLMAATFYYLADIVWGISYEHHDMSELFPVIYLDTIFYFVFMFLTMLTWIRYIVAYLDKRGRRSMVLLYTVWTMFTLGLIYLLINHFYPFIFSFNEKHEYIAEPGRYIAFILQIAVYMMTSSYLLYIAHKTNGQQKGRYIAVGLAGQIFDEDYPFYAMGLIIGTCVIHSFVEAGEKKEKEIYDHIAKSLAEDYEAMYYINIETGEYLEFSTSQEYESMNVPADGRDFFAETRVNAARYAHPDDREFAESLYYRETMIRTIIPQTEDFSAPKT